MKLYIGDNLKKLREEKKVTQDALAEYLGVTYQAVSRWENGIAYPDIELLPEIARFFEVSLEELMGCENREKAAEEAVVHFPVVRPGKFEVGDRYAFFRGQTHHGVCEIRVFREKEAEQRTVAFPAELHFPRDGVVVTMTFQVEPVNVIGRDLPAARTEEGLLFFGMNGLHGTVPRTKKRSHGRISPVV